MEISDCQSQERNVLADYGELYQLRRENKILSDTNENMQSELNTLLGQLAIPSVRNMIFPDFDNASPSLIFVLI